MRHLTGRRSRFKGGGFKAGRLREVGAVMARHGDLLGKGGLAALASLALLAACGSDSSPLSSGAQAPCPNVVILAEGADMTRFRAGASGDLTALTADARIAGFEANCDYAGRARTELTLRVTPRFDVERGPAAEGRTLDIPWFVALSDAGDRSLLDRQAFTSRATFGPNVVRTTIQGQTARLSLPLEEGRHGTDTLLGGAGADLFVLRPGDGFDWIEDFTSGTDQLALLGFGRNAGVILALGVEVSGGLRIDLGGGDGLLLAGLTRAQILGADIIA